MNDDEFYSLCKANGFGAVARDELPLIPRGMLKGLVDAAYAAGQEAEREAICIQWEGADATIAEVERLRAELARCQSLLDETRTELSICGALHSVAKKEWQLEVEKVNRLEAKLAAAEEASELPVEIQSVYVNKYLGSVVVFIGDEKGAVEFDAWLCDRVKERGER